MKHHHIARILYPTAAWVFALSCSPGVSANTLTVSKAGTGTGTVNSSDTFIKCGSTCSYSSYSSGDTVSLTALPDANSTFTSWNATGGCNGTTSASTSVTLSNTTTTCTANFTINNYTLNVTKTGSGTGTVSSSGAQMYFSCGTTCSGSSSAGSLVNLMAMPDATSTFTGWGGNCSGTSSATSVTLDAAATCTATFNLTSGIPLTITKLGTGSGTVTDSKTAINCGSTCSGYYASGSMPVTLTAIADANSTFTSWGQDCSGSSASTLLTLNPAGNTCTATFTANYTPPPLVHFGVDKTGNGSGTVSSATGNINCGATCSAEYGQGSQETLTATPDANSKFYSWMGACKGTNPTTTVTIDTAKLCTAQFDTLNTVYTPPPTLTVTKTGPGIGTITSADGGIKCGTDCSADYAPGGKAILTATPDAKSIFTGWSGSCSGTDASATVPMETGVNKTCSANFEQKVFSTLTVNQGGKGSGAVRSEDWLIKCGLGSTVCAKEYASGDIVVLTATPEARSTFTGWSGDCSGSSASSMVLMTGTAKTCTATFETNTLTVSKTGSGTGMVTSSDGVISCGPTCSAKYAPNSNASSNVIALTATPDYGSAFTGWSGDCSSASNPASLTLATDKTCTANFEPKCEANIYVYPQTFDFGTEMLGGAASTPGYISTSGYGCKQPLKVNVDSFTLTGNPANEFSLKDQQCYNGSWGNYSYSSCSFKIAFKPTVEGNKEAALNYSFNDATVLTSPVPIKATVTGTGQPGLEVSPQSHDFGSVTAGSLWWWNNSQMFTLKNTGNVNLSLDKIDLTGNDKADFQGQQWWWCSSYYWGWGGTWKPGEQCYLYMYFAPMTEGAKQANLTINSNAPAVTVTLTGTATAPVDCSDANITIESSEHAANQASGDTADHRWATNDPNYSYWWWWGTNQGETEAWQRVNNSTGSKLPTKDDVVRIKSGHTIMGIPWTTVRTLCIEQGGTLESWDARLGYPYLGILATDYLENKGTIRGKDGANETSNASCGNNYWWWYFGNDTCAQPGTSIYLDAGKLLNAGEIIAGRGGDGQQNGAWGGGLGIYGTNVANTGSIRAGNGGSLLGDQPGNAGGGGYVSMWAKDSVQSSTPTGITTGDGGNCHNPNTSQVGGNGGNIWINAQSQVALEGVYTTGKGGTNCSTNGQRGRFNTDPSVLSLSGTNTKIDGGDISIYGGKDWKLDLSNLTDTVLTASGDITLAVGEGGSIDLHGSTGKIFKTTGQINLFANNIVLDDGVKLTDLMEASQVVVGPAKILRDVSLSTAGNVSGSPSTTVPLSLSLSNGSPEGDTFSVSANDSAGWKLGSLPATVTLKALETTNLTLNVTLPDTRSTTDKITVTAISQADPSVKATAEIQAVVTSETMEATMQEWSTNVGSVMLPTTSTSIGITPASPTTQGTTATLPTTGAGSTSGATTGTEGSPVSATGTTSSTVPTTGGGSATATTTGTGSITTPATGSSTDTTTTSPSGTTAIPTSGGSGSTSSSAGNSTTSSSVGNMPSTSEVAAGNSTTSSSVGNMPSTTEVAGGMAITPTTAFVNSTGFCPSTGVVDTTCINHGQVMKDASVKPTANVAGGQLTGVINNEGFISGVTIQADTTLKGGTLTGYIINQGTLADFRFVGASVKGGTLAGTITNASQVGGVFIDVTLAPNTHIIGGRLQGRIKGDDKAPALLDNVTVMTGSHLSGVKPGNNVKLQRGVTIDGQTATQLPVATKLDLPSLGKTLATNAKGQVVKTATKFAGGVAINDRASFQKMVVSKPLTDMLDIRGLITVDPAYVGQQVEMLVYMTYHLSPEETPISLMLDARGNFLPWDEKLTSLVAFQKNVTLQSEQPITLYKGVMMATGVLKLHFGYRLPEGIIVSSSETIDVTISK